MASRFSLLPKPIGFNINIYPNNPVIYKIVNSINNKIYIGRTVYFRKRLCQHHRALINNKHHSLHLQNAFNKYGMDKFYVEIIENSNKDIISTREEYWIKNLHSYNRKKGYNMSIDVSFSHYGKRSLQCRMNISKALTGKRLSEETKIKISNALRGMFVGKNNHWSKSIIKYDKNMNLIEKFVSVREASKKTGIHRNSIGNNLASRSRSAGGFIFKHKI